MAAEADFTDEDLIGYLLVRADEAREDPKAFFEFVLRDEVENRPIICAPHQELSIEFVRAHRHHCVLMLPFGHGKTYTLTGLTLMELGGNLLERGAFVSLAESQSEKPVSMVRQHIEGSPELALVFPNLRPTQRRGEKWTTTDLTVDRPPGIRDPSLVARGFDSKGVLGSRWSRGVFDDCVDEESSSTPEQREKQWQTFQKKFLTRLDPRNGACCWSCTAWHEDDVTHRLMRPIERNGRQWPALVMRADGHIFLRNTAWTTPLLRRAHNPPAEDPNWPGEVAWRLTAHDPDPDDHQTLWPARFNAEQLEEERRQLHPALYNQLYLNICRDDASALCRQEYIQRCREVGVRLQQLHPWMTQLQSAIDRSRFPHPIFVGVDLAFTRDAANDECCLFVLTILPDPDAGKALLSGLQPHDRKRASDLIRDASDPEQVRGVLRRVEEAKGKPRKATPIRVPLWIESGRWGVQELYERMLSIQERFEPFAFAFENNAAQEGIRQLMQLGEKRLVLKPHTTDATKNSMALGVPSIFGEFANGAWGFPCRPGKALEPELHKLVTQSLNYSPKDHPGDTLMGGYFARDLARKWGALTRGEPGEGRRAAASLMTR